jgi:hypothetical protein
MVTEPIKEDKICLTSLVGGRSAVVSELMKEQEFFALISGVLRRL